MIPPEYLEALRASLKERGFGVAEGLTGGQLGAIEDDYGFRFPADLRAMLMQFVPVGEDFPDWSATGSLDLIEWLDYPAEGLTFDVEENGYWHSSFGPRPEDMDEAVEEVRRRVAMAPILVPLFGHCFIPAMPDELGNPAFGVTQSRIVVAASDFAWAMHDELGVISPMWPRGVPRTIEFWSQLAETE